LDEEDLFLFSGKSPLKASTESLSGMVEEDDPELGTLKQLAIGMRDLEKQYLAAGDANSAANLAKTGMTLGNQLESGDSGKYLIDQLVSMSIEANSLRELDSNTSYDFLDGQTPAQVLQQLKDQKTALRELSVNSSAAYLSMTQDEMASYAERSKIYGEIGAMQWLVQQHPPNPSPNAP
jgi:hypothetical protein